jgi:WD40 repeat protein
LKLWFFKRTGENGHIKIWQIPSDSGLMDLKGNLTEATADLLSHKHKVVSVDFHPLASNLLVSTSGDLTAKLWDLSSSKDVITLKVLPHLSVFFFKLTKKLKEKKRIEKRECICEREECSEDMMKILSQRTENWWLLLLLTISYV